MRENFSEKPIVFSEIGYTRNIATTRCPHADFTKPNPGCTSLGASEPARVIASRGAVRAWTEWVRQGLTSVSRCPQ